MRSATWSTYVGAMTGGILASACCLGPLLVGILGVGSASFASAFEPYRPYMLALTVILLGGAFFMTYRERPAAVCAKDGSCSSAGPSRRQQGLLWTITAMTLAAASYPYWISAGTNPVRATESKQATIVELAITGMTCDGCSINVQNALQKVPGVKSVEVNYEDGRARLFLQEPVGEEELTSAIGAIGYSAVVSSKARATTTKPGADSQAKGD